MIVRLGFLVAASVAAYAVKQLNIKSSKPTSSIVRLSENGEMYFEQPDEAENKEQSMCSLDTRSEKGKYKEEEDVKLISSTNCRADYSQPDVDDEDILHTERFDGIEMSENASELERFRELVKEMEEREVKQELDFAELQRQLKVKTAEINMMSVTIKSLQAERKKLREEIEQRDSVKEELEVARNKIKEVQRQIQLDSNQMKVQLLFHKQQVAGFQAKEEEASKKNAENKKVKDLEVEVLELNRKNKEHQHENRELTVKHDAEVSNLRHANEDLLKQVEGLQMNRFSEVEELVYLRWVNACLRYELRNYQAPRGNFCARELNTNLSFKSQEKAKQLMLDNAGLERWQGDTDIESNVSHPSSPGSEDLEEASFDSSNGKFSNFIKKPSLIRKLKKWGKSKDDSIVFSSPPRSPSGNSPRRLSTGSRPRGQLEELTLRKAGDGKIQQLTESPKTPTLENVRTQELVESLDSVAASFRVMSKSAEVVLDEKYPAPKDRHKLVLEREKEIKQKAEKAREAKLKDKSNWISKRETKPVTLLLPAKLSLVRERTVISGDSERQTSDSTTRLPRVSRAPPKPSSNNPSPPPSPQPSGPPPPGSLKREAKKDASSLLSSESNVSDARSNMIGEIEKRSSFLIAAKADVETQGDFVQSLANHVRAASFTGIEDVVAFVNWLDEELSFLVDELEVLKHLNWPKGKADALRAAAFEYQDIMKLDKQVTSFNDEPNLPCEAALTRMYNLLEKVEQSVYALLHTRDMAIARYRDFGIPVDWLLDSGVLGKIKLSSVQLARKYMKRVASEVDATSGLDKEPNREFLLLQGVRFAFRVHQFAGGFDAESMKAFEELRSRAKAQIKGDNKHEA